MPALYYPSRAYSWAYPVFSEEDRATIVAAMEKRGRQAFDYLRRRKHLWTPYESHRNRAWHFLGELALAFLDEIPEAERWLEYSTTIFYTCYPVWSDSDGGWHEGFAYWNSYISRFGFWALVMDSAFEIDVFKRPFFQKTGNYGLYCGPPGTDHCGFGDQAEKHDLPTSAGALMAMLASGTRNPYWKWYAEEVGADLPENYLGFLWASRSVDLEAKPPTELPGSICFRGVGLAVMNANLADGRDNVQLFFKSSPMGTVSHGYNANNTIHLNINGLPAILNTGRRDIHGSPHHTEWMWDTKSQNAILVNNKGQRKHSPEARGRIVFFETSPAVDIVVGEAGDSYDNLERWTRSIVFLKPEVIVLHDVLEAPEPSTYQWLLHAPSRFTIENDIDPPTVSWKGKRGSFAVDFLAPKNLVLSQTNGYDPPPHEWAEFDIDEWHLRAEPIGRSAAQSFLAVIRVNDALRQYKHDGNALEFEMEGGRAKIEFGDEGLRVTRGEID
jgi:hypothetical protein